MKENSPYHPEIFADSYIKSFYREFEKIRLQWEKERQNNFDCFLEEYSKFNRQYAALLETAPITDLWNHASQLTQRLQICLGNLENGTPETVPPQIQTICDSVFDKTIANIPETATLEIPAEFWNAGGQDSIYIRLRKFITRSTFFVKYLPLRFLNLILKLFKKPVRTLPVQQRIFSNHLLIKEILYIASLQFLRESWEQKISVDSRILDKLHNVFEENIDSLAAFSIIKHDRKKFFPDISLEDIESAFQPNFESFRNSATERFIAAWAGAGTFLYANKKFSSDLIIKSCANLNDQFLKDTHSWFRFLDAQTESFRKDLDLFTLQTEFLHTIDQKLEDLTQTLSRRIMPEMIAIKNEFSSGIQTIGQSATVSELKKTLTAENRRILNYLRKKQIPAVIDITTRVNFPAVLFDLQNVLYQKTGLVPEENRILIISDEKEIPHRIKLEPVRLQELIRSESFPQLSATIKTAVNSLRNNLEKVLRNITEIDQVVEFNIEAGLNLLESDNKDKLNEAKSTAVSGFERAIDQVNSYSETLNATFTEIREIILESLKQFLEEIQDMADSEKIFALKLRLARAKTRQELRQKITDFWYSFRQIAPRVWKKIKDVFNAAQSQYFKIRKITGLESDKGGIGDSLTLFLSSTKESIESLPYVYQRLFRFEPLEDDRFFGGRNEEMQMLQDEFNTWQSGLFGSALLTGERGSGRTTLIRFAREGFFSKIKTIVIDIDTNITTNEQLFAFLKKGFGQKDVGSLDELEHSINIAENRVVCIIENIQNLFLRTVDGFDALERFLLFISRTGKTVFWVASCTYYSWQYLEKVIGISKFFGKNILMDALNTEEIREVILKRHRVSGYKLKFEISRELEKNRRLKKLKSEDEKMAYLEKRFFDQLCEVSAGNITIAMLFWLRAVSNVTDEYMVLKPDINFDHSAFLNLPKEDLFTLGAIFQHERLSVSDHARIFRTDPEDSQVALNRLCNTGLLFIKENAFQIHPFVYRPLAVTLKSKNILH